MKLLFSSMFFYEYSTDVIAKAAEMAGYDGVEFWLETPHFWVDRDLGKLECFADMYLALHAPVLDLNPVSVNQSVCELTLRENLFAISLAGRLGANPVTIHAGKRSAAREPVWADYLSLHDFLRVIGKFAKIKKVIPSLENSEKGVNNLCKTPEEVNEFVRAYDLGFTLDIKHALVNGDPVRYLNVLFDRICNIHVSYFDERNRHVQPSKSEKVANILREIADLGYDEIITVELDDLGIGKLDFRKKVEIIRKEANFVGSFFV
jgi:sugar phosphate isomerase/epimerase